MLLLGGAMIKFDDLHKSISKKVYVPVLGDVMVTRWAYEALMVEEFKDNRFEKQFFPYDMEISQNDWLMSFLIPSLKVTINANKVAGKNPEYEEFSRRNLYKINYHIHGLSEITGVKPGSWIKGMTWDRFTDQYGDQGRQYLDSISVLIRVRNKIAMDKRDSLFNRAKSIMGEEEFQRLRNRNYNENVANIVLNRLNTNKIYDTGKRFIQKADPIFMKPGSRAGRAQFFAPYKQLGNLKIDTIVFNMFAIWLMILVLFITLYYNILKRFIVFLETRNIPIWRKFGRELLPI